MLLEQIITLPAYICQVCNCIYVGVIWSLYFTCDVQYHCWCLAS